MANNWIPVKYGLPKEPGAYIVFVHEMDEDPFPLFDDNGKKINLGFVTSAFYDIRQGGIWKIDDEAYGSDLSKVDTKTAYYISHWMPMPDKPEEGET